MSHPAGKSMIELSRAQDEEVGDGTTSVIVLTGEMLVMAEPLLMRAIHPTVIVQGYTRALQKATETCAAIAKPISVTDMEAMTALVKSCVGTKFSARWGELVIKLALEAKGCHLLMATALRSPVTRSVSDAVFHQLTAAAELRAFSAIESNYQAKYLMHNYFWKNQTCAPDLLAREIAKANQTQPPSWFVSQCVPGNPILNEEAPLQQARLALAMYDLVGRTDQLDDLAQRLNQVITGGAPMRLAGAAERPALEVADADMLWIARHNVDDLRLLADFCVNASAPSACDAVHTARRRARDSAWARARHLARARSGE